MRLDKMLSECGIASRSESAQAARAGKITVNGVQVKKADLRIDPERDAVVYCGKNVVYRRFVYLLLNKPDGYVSATEDGKDPTVVSLLPEEYRKRGIFPCGRLDKHTLGLMLLTDDGALAHRLLSPKNHVSKQYAFQVKFPLSEQDVVALEAGVDIGGYVTKPCRIRLSDAHRGTITITEGKYHQIKLMMEAVHNQITFLERRSFGPLLFDDSLQRGEWRSLTDAETEELRAAAEAKGT